MVKKINAEADIFNADIATLFWKALPSRTLTVKNTNCSDGKYSKEKLAVLGTCNMNGTEQLLLMVFGKAAKFCCFKGVKA